MDANEIKARIEANRAVKVQACPRCARDNCSCFTSGEFWDLQRQLRSKEIELTDLRALAGQLAEALAMNGGTCSDCDHQICGRERDALDAAKKAGLIK